MDDERVMNNSDDSPFGVWMGETLIVTAMVFPR